MPEISKADIRRLRELLRDHHARDDAGLFVAEGPRVVEAALTAGASVEQIYCDPDHSIAGAAAAHGIDVVPIDARAADRIGLTVTPQPVFALVRFVRRGIDALEDALTADDETLATASDDASLVEARGGRVKIYDWKAPNPKSTTPEDLAAAEAELSRSTS